MPYVYKLRLAALGVGLRVSGGALDALAEGSAGGPYGARPLRRTVAEKLSDAAADMLLTGELKSGDCLSAEAENGEIVLKKA